MKGKDYTYRILKSLASQGKIDKLKLLQSITRTDQVNYTKGLADEYKYNRIAVHVIIREWIDLGLVREEQLPYKKIVALEITRKGKRILTDVLRWEYLD